MATMTEKGETNNPTPQTPTTNPQVQLHETGEWIQQRVAGAQQGIQNFPALVKAKAQDVAQSTKQALTDFSGGINKDADNFIIQCHVWSGICMVAFAAATVCGQKVFYGLIEGVFGSWSTVMIIGVLVPCLIWGSIQLLMKQLGSPPQMVLGSSVILGVLLGSMVKNAKLRFFAPPVCALPFGMAVAANLMGKSPAVMSDRRIFLPAMLLPAAVVYLLIALNELSSSYVAYVVTIVIAAVVDLQMKMGALVRGNVSPLPIEQWYTVVILAMADTLAYSILSESK